MQKGNHGGLPLPMTAHDGSERRVGGGPRASPFFFAPLSSSLPFLLLLYAIALGSSPTLNPGLGKHGIIHYLHQNCIPVRTSQQLQAEIEGRFGFFPPFFAPALDSPQVLDNLWQQTVSAYLDNPLSPLFKEKLNALLSRHCAVPYCMVCHSSALRPLGLSAGEILALLESPVPAPDAGDVPLGRLPVPAPAQAAAPPSGSPLEQALLVCATLVFLDSGELEPCRAELRRLLGPDLYPHLIAYLAYIQTCHFWMEAHPDVSYEADKRAQEHLGPLLAEEPALADFFAHYGERMARLHLDQAVEAARTEERRQAEAALHESEDKLRLLVEGARDYAMILLDTDARVTHWNAGAQRILGYAESEVLGSPADLIFTPEDRAAGAPEQEMEKARAEGKALDIRWHLRKDGSRFWGDGVMERLRDEDGNERGFAKILRDATDRRQIEAAREEAEAALRESESRFRRMADAIPHIAWTTDAEGAIDYYNQRWYDYSGLDFGRTRDWGWQDVVHPADLAGAGAVWRAALRAGTISEVEYRLRRADGAYRWHLGRSQPVRDESGRIIRWVGTATDIEERRQIEDERERLLAEAEARAEREGLLNRIGTILRDSTDPNAIQRQATAALGAALNADRCFSMACEEARDLSVVSQEWRRDGLAPLAGAYQLSDYQMILDPLQSGGTLVVQDVRAEARFAPLAPALERLGLRAAVWVPLFDDGRLVGLVGVAMAGAARAWTPDEVALVETVAAQTRTAAEAARLRLREHNIATHLQEALRPAVPDAVPGLQLKKYYEVALAEAEVGGDFYDVFSIDKGCTALVVGDLSGKGLAAAAQVSTVRNMLRAMIYPAPTLAEAVTRLNDILAENELLTGFATLFVGVYDSGAGTLTYVNCGQEPGLVRRAGRGESDAGRVEELLPTGPVLGTFPGVVFREQSVSLAPGDALALFTDGLTEAGPSRTDMLGIEGVTALLCALRPLSAAVGADQRAEDFLLTLIAGVDEYAQSGVRDDVCVLVAVVEG